MNKSTAVGQKMGQLLNNGASRSSRNVQARSRLRRLRPLSARRASPRYHVGHPYGSFARPGRTGWT